MQHCGSGMCVADVLVLAGAMAPAATFESLPWASGAGPLPSSSISKHLLELPHAAHLGPPPSIPRPAPLSGSVIPPSPDSPIAESAVATVAYLQHSSGAIRDSLMTAYAHLHVAHLGHAGCEGVIDAGRFNSDDLAEVLPEGLPVATVEELVSRHQYMQGNSAEGASTKAGDMADEKQLKIGDQHLPEFDLPAP